MKYSVKRYWEVCDTVDVEAENVEEAIEIATELGLTTGEYVMDSFNIDEEDVQETTNGN